MANTINDIKSVGSIIAKMGAEMLADKVQFVKAIDKEEGLQGDVNGYQKGDTITINKPARFTVGTTADLTSALQDVTEEKTTLQLSTQSTIGVNLTSKEIATTLGLKQWAKRVLEPAMSAIAQNIETTCLTTAKNSIYNSVGTAAAASFDTDTILSARALLMKQLAPSQDFKLLLNSDAMRSAVNSRKGYPNPDAELSKQYKNGYMGTADGFDYLENNLVATHTRGTQATTGGTVTTTLSGQGVATMNVTGTSGGTLKQGDVFTVANVYRVHPITKVVTGDLQQFVVTADNTASGTAYTGVTFAPAIYTTGTLQNVNSFPQGSAAITLIGATSSVLAQNIAFHPSAFRFASAPLVMPTNAMMAGQESAQGINLRVWQDPVILTDKVIVRLDCLWGIAAVRPEWAVRLTA